LLWGLSFKGIIKHTTTNCKNRASLYYRDPRKNLTEIEIQNSQRPKIKFAENLTEISEKICTGKPSISTFTLNRKGEKGYKIDCLACRALVLNLLFNLGVQILIPQKLKYQQLEISCLADSTFDTVCPFFSVGMHVYIIHRVELSLRRIKFKPTCPNCFKPWVVCPRRLLFVYLFFFLTLLVRVGKRRLFL